MFFETSYVMLKADYKVCLTEVQFDNILVVEDVITLDALAFVNICAPDSGVLQFLGELAMNFDSQIMNC